MADVGAAGRADAGRGSGAPGAGDGGEASDADLVAAARRGDRAAFSALYERHARTVHGVLMARVGRTDADDLVQEVFIKAWRSMGTIREGASLGAWLCKVARRSASDLRRSARRGRMMIERAASQIPTAGVAPATDDGRLKEDAGAATGFAASAMAAIRALPEAYRETLILRLVEGMTGPQIARATGLTEGSVRVNLCRGMKLLREKLMMEGCA